MKGTSFTRLVRQLADQLGAANGEISVQTDIALPKAAAPARPKLNLDDLESDGLEIGDLIARLGELSEDEMAKAIERLSERGG